MHLVNDYHDADVAIHGGKFHADEMIALQLYEVATDKEIAVVRLNSIPEDFKGVCIDIGDKSGREDLLIYDHHKSEAEKTIDKRAACGKVFDAYKDKIIPKLFGDSNPDLAERVFKRDILDPIQKQDNCGNPHISQLSYYNRSGNPIEAYYTIPLSFSSAIHKFNPNYQAADRVDEYFTKAYNCSKSIIESYSEILSDKLKQGLIADTPRASNFDMHNFDCDVKFFNKEQYTEYSDTIFYNLKMTQKGITVQHHSDRVFTIGDVFTLGKTKEAEEFLTQVLDGYSRFERGFHESTDIVQQKIQDINQKGDGVLVLDQYIPWNNAVLHSNRNRDLTVSIDLVVFPSQRDNRWNVQAVLDRSNNGTYRVNLPPELQSISEHSPQAKAQGICFASKYMAAFTSKEDAVSFAYSLVEKSRTLAIPENVTTTRDIDLSPDDRKSLRNIQFPNSLKEIAPKTFRFCHNVKSLDIPANVNIGTSAFSACTHLESLTIRPGTKTIGAYAFSDCPSLKEINLPDTINYLNPTIFTNSNNIQKVQITMTSMSNILNVVKIGNKFPNANITVNCNEIGHEQFTFDELKEMLMQANEKMADMSKSNQLDAQILNAEYEPLKAQISDTIQENSFSGQNETADVSDDTFSCI